VHLTCVRQQGQTASHNIDSVLNHRHPNSLAIYCPACPEVGFNVFQEFLANLSCTERYVCVHHWRNVEADLCDTDIRSQNTWVVMETFD
jgi:hypothetical protein